MLYHLNVDFFSFGPVEPIKSMVFKFDSSVEEYLTQDNNETPHRLEIFPGKYSPTCTVEGSNPIADVEIMNGNLKMPGKRTMDLTGSPSTQYVAEAAEFTG